VQKFPEGVPREILSDALVAARRAKASDEDSVRRAFQAFTAVKGVRIPTASAFLATIRPKQFTIIDRWAYKALGVEFRSGVGEYLSYLRFCHQEAAKWGIALREYDQALWQYGVELTRRSRR
jgi:hypothetical protein